MGSVCPVTLPPKLDEQIKDIFKKTLQTLSSDGHPYSGFLFAGLMVDDNNFAQVLEFNCRLGDPETQVILPGLGRDLLLNMWLTSTRQPWSSNPWTDDQQPHAVRHDSLHRCFVVVASPEYPNGSAPRRKLVLPEIWNADCSWIPSGVDENLSTSAGRIGGVLSAATTAQKAVSSCYSQVSVIGFDAQDMLRPHFRKDIDFPSLHEDESSK
jgi:phosphoribosylamine--glycine ligase